MKSPLHMALLLMMVSAFVAIPYQPTAAQSRQRCFTEESAPKDQNGAPFCVSDPILRYWEENGGLSVFGYPITHLAEETIEGIWTGPTQWFERDRLEDHSNEGLGVLAGRLGARILELEGLPWEMYPQVDSAPAGCHYFPETRHSMCGIFARYWQVNGGLERFGYPITEGMYMTIGDWSGQVQYFERRRMEHHTELAGTEYELLLGLLGSEVYAKIHAPTPPIEECENTVHRDMINIYDKIEPYVLDGIGCPTFYHRDRNAATQNFERGTMIWVDLPPEEPGELNWWIYAFLSMGRYGIYEDLWRDGDPERPDAEAPPGTRVPSRGFGRVWINDAVLRSDIGGAIDAEQANTANIQFFEHGGIIWLTDTQMVYVFGKEMYQMQVFQNR